jgi:hypothetical protein
MSTIQVSQENIVCSKCGKNGHNYNDPICDMFSLPGPFMYKTKCSRCNQPGHRRDNKNKCSLIGQYPDYNYGDIVSQLVHGTHVITIPREPIIRIPIRPRAQARPIIPTHETTKLNSLRNIIQEFNQVINRMSKFPHNRSNSILNGVILHDLFKKKYDEIIFTKFKEPLFDIDTLLQEVTCDDDLKPPINVSAIREKLENIGRGIDDFVNTYYFNFKDDIIGDVILFTKRNIKVIHITELNIKTAKECNICLETPELKLACEFECNHQFCVDCVCDFIKSCSDTIRKPMNCPICRSKISIIKCYDETQLQKIDKKL